MFLEQICPGQINSHPQAIHTFIYKNERYIVYATGSKIVIYADPDNLVQIIAASPLFKDHHNLEPVTAVAGNSNTGQIALAYHNQIAILKPNDNDKKWELESVLDTKELITCLDWSINNLLLSAGKEILLWDFSQPENQIICSKKPAADIVLAKFDPRSNTFATMGRFDRLVTIWYQSNFVHNSPFVGYSFTFISHPKYVTHFVWRNLPGTAKSNDCALFTMARDGIGRFWSPINLEQPHMLYMCAVIDSNQSLVTSEPEEINKKRQQQKQHSVDRMLTGDGGNSDSPEFDDFSPIHYISCTELKNAVYADFKFHSKHEKFDQKLERIRDRVRDTPDLLFRIQSDGSLTFWGVQHLNTTPRRVPRVFVVLRVDKALDPLDVIYFLNPTHILHDYAHIQSSSTIKPIELSLIARNPHGQLRCYSLNLVDFLDSTSFSPRLHLKYTLLGHQHSIKSLYQTQKNRFCTTGIDGQINVWKYELRETCGRTNTQLQLDCSIFIDSNNILAAPVDKDKYLAVYDGSQVTIYEFDNQDCHLYHSKVCSVPNLPILSSLHVYNQGEVDDKKLFLLIGVSTKEKKIVIWQLTTGGDSNAINIEWRGINDMDWGTEEQILVVSASQWATSTVSKLLHRLTEQNKLVLVVSLGTTIFFYSVTDDMNWEVLYTFDTLIGPINQIKCAPNTVAIVSGKGCTNLSIWSQMRCGYAPVLAKKFEFSEPICDMAWNVTSDAQFILAVAFPKRVVLFGQKRAINARNDDDIWICYTEFTVDTPEDITALAWVDCGVLVVAAGNQLCCYLKWMTEQDTVAKNTKFTNNALEPMSSIFDISYEMNGPLPFYHPNHLIHYIMWRKMDLVHAVLSSLYSFLKQFIDEEDNAVTEYPPVSFSNMLKLQNEKTKKSKQGGKHQYNALFSADDDGDATKGSEEDDEHVNRSLTASEAKNLTHSLKFKSLPGLNEDERVHLIAMVDTIVEITNQGESLDENGARFTALLENHFYLARALPEQNNELGSRDFIWALHSQSQDLLLERCVRLCDNKLMWEDARSLGIFLWLQKSDVVMEQMTNVARNIYLSKNEFRDPVDCTLYYLALRKKNLLEGLWKTASFHREQTAMKKFLANDFSDPRWQRAASKNAFALLGKQRFEYAAAFFLLADKLKDTVNVILKNMKDFQLAIAIIRVYEGDHSPLLKEVLENHVIPMAIETNDRWLISISYWLLNKQQEAVRAMVVPLSQFTSDIDTTQEDSAAEVYNPDAFILFHYLTKKLQHEKTLSVPYDIEYEFWMSVARSYERLGCPMLALHILTKYHMKSPAAIKNEPVEELPVKLERAEDLFAEPSAAVSTGLFDDYEHVKKGNTMDLFANNDDLFAEPKKPSYANNLFDDENDIFDTPKKSTTGDLFDDKKDIFTSTNEEAGTLVSDDDDGEEEEDSLSEQIHDGLDTYKALLVIRMLQTFFHAASGLYNSLEEPDKIHEANFRTRFLRNRQSLMELGESVKITPHIFSRLLMEKSIETDVFPLYLYILDEKVPKDFDVHQFLRSFKVGCFEVNEVALMPQELDYSTLVFVENWSKHVIKTFSIWSSLRTQYCNPETASLTTRQIALTTYISLTLITLKERQYEGCWPLLYYLKMMLEALGSNNGESSIKNCFSLLLKNDAKMVDIVVNDFESFSEGSVFGFDMNEEVYRPLFDSKDKSPGANILELASLNFLLSSIEHAMQCQGKHNKLSEQLSDFIWSTLLDPIAFRAHCLTNTIASQLENDLSRHNVLRQFKTLRHRKYWHSIKSLCPSERLLPFIGISSTSSINIISDDCHDHFRSVYQSASTAYAFCLNSSAHDTIAVCLKTEIQEIDISKASNFGSVPLGRTRSVSSAGMGHDLSLDSYPDTEDDSDLSDNDQDSLHTLKQPTGTPGTRRVNKMPASSKVSGSTTPLQSPAGSKIFDEHVIQKAHHLNVEHLHDSLRRTLTKGSETNLSRTPNASTPTAMDNAERERMISLRRAVSASCAETHPQYPFYITGLEANNNGPSAILWQFGQEREIASYYGCQGKATRIHFDQFGQKFGAGDTSGNLCLWRFDAHAHSNKPYYTVNCHSKATRDFTFINSSSLIATAGTSGSMSRKRDHVTLWDTLLPPSKAMVYSLPGHEGGAYAIAYEPNSQLLFSGGKQGEIVVSDIRQRTTMHHFTAHQSRIRSIAIDTESKALMTGSIDGELKIWDVSTYKLRQSFDIQPRNRFLAPSFNRIPLKAFGVTQIQQFNDTVYTSGPNGIVKCSRSVLTIPTFL